MKNDALKQNIEGNMNFRIWDKKKSVMITNMIKAKNIAKYNDVNYESNEDYENDNYPYEDTEFYPFSSIQAPFMLSELSNCNGFVVMQSTGFNYHDVEIFDGDIIVRYRENIIVDYKNNTNRITYVVKIGKYKQDGSGDEHTSHSHFGVHLRVFNHDKCYVDEHEYTTSIFDLELPDDYYKIVGNIYENPELLG